MSTPGANADVLTADVVVVGGGPAGEVVAGRVADRGLDTVLVERELVGGECSYWGCIPSKTLLRPGEVLAAARNTPGAREAVTGSIDVPEALAWRNFMVSNYDDAGQVAWACGAGIEVVRGRGALEGRGAVVVDGTRPPDEVQQELRLRLRGGRRDRNLSAVGGNRSGRGRSRRRGGRGSLFFRTAGDRSSGEAKDREKSERRISAHHVLLRSPEPKHAGSFEVST